MTRKHLLGSLFAALVIIPTAASAQEMPPTCTAAGVLTLEGECQGTDAVFCSDPNNPDTATIVSYPCADLLADGSVVGGCDEIDGWGSWCVYDAGEACTFSSNQGSVFMACGSDAGGLDTDYACSYSEGCVAGYGSCTPPAQGQDYASTCDGNNLVVGCTAYGQKVIADCTDADLVGGTGCSNNACVGIGAGDYCGDGFLCADGLTCDPGTNQCTNGMSVGDGDGDGDGDTTVGDGDGDGDTTAGDGDGDGDTTAGDGDGDTTGGDGDDPCEAQGKYGDGVCDQNCSEPDPDCGGRDDPSEEPAGGLCSSTGASTTSLFGVLALGLLAIRRRRD